MDSESFYMCLKIVPDPGILSIEAELEAVCRWTILSYKTGSLVWKGVLKTDKD